MSQTVSLSFYRFPKWSDRLWALGMMGFARLLMPKVPGIGFWKLCGSGTGEGFTPIPNTAVYAILATWPDEETARAGTQTDPFTRYVRRADESWTVFLSTASVRGNWSGQTPFEPDGQTLDGPLAALTRATLRPSIMQKFWGHVPSISDVIGSDQNVAFKIGIGEVPWLQQVTFSLWPNTQTMASFARSKDGPHAKAIQAVRDGAWFREELYARFAILGDHGTWGGESPLNRLKDTA